MSPRLTITPVSEAQRDKLDTLARSYFREILPNGPAYFPNALDRYWIEPGRHPYLIALDGTPIGFALVWNHKGGVHELVEFTIVPDYRKAGLGTDAASMIFQALGGDWVLGVGRHAADAMAFWQQCLEACEGVFDIQTGPPRTANQIGSYTFRVAR